MVRSRLDSIFHLFLELLCDSFPAHPVGRPTLIAMSSPVESGTIIRAGHLGPGVNLSSCICLVIMCLVVILKVSSKLIRNHKTIEAQSLQLDDYCSYGKKRRALSLFSSWLIS